LTKPQIITTRKRHLITYVEHWHTSSTLLKLGAESEGGSYHQFLASIVFTAFALEAFLNHVGNLVHTNWSELDRASSRKKLAAITKQLSITVNFKDSPWQVFPELVEVRNAIAHGRSEDLEDDIPMSPDDYESELGIMLEANWQTYSNKEQAERVRKEVESLFRIVWEGAGLDKHRLFMHGMQTRHTSISDSC
jgi:hypothetical protein